jgi:hypothetical protein
MKLLLRKPARAWKTGTQPLHPQNFVWIEARHQGWEIWERLCDSEGENVRMQLRWGCESSAVASNLRGLWRLDMVCGEFETLTGTLLDGEGEKSGSLLREGKERELWYFWLNKSLGHGMSLLGARRFMGNSQRGRSHSRGEWANQMALCHPSNEVHFEKWTLTQGLPWSFTSLFVARQSTEEGED